VVLQLREATHQCEGKAHDTQYRQSSHVFFLSPREPNTVGAVLFNSWSTHAVLQAVITIGRRRAPGQEVLEPATPADGGEEEKTPMRVAVMYSGRGAQRRTVSRRYPL
jgi:hypothetical protein